VPKLVAILEDDPARIAAMRPVLADLLPDCEHHFFDHAATMIAWLGGHLPDVVLISLDHDLPLVRGEGGTVNDYGTGRQVIDFLCALDVRCPVIVHSSNHFFAPGMIQCLKDAGLVHARVYPYDDLAWVGLAWAEQIRAYQRDGRLARQR
jgi:hypothetical protein